MSLIVVPVDLKEANSFVANHHRHHDPLTVGARFALGCVDADGLLRGVAIVGPPAARLGGHRRDVAEVRRVATDGTRNACSILLGACARVAKAMGFQRVQTFTLPEEGGASLRAAGWVEEHTTTGGVWATPSRDRSTRNPQPKTRWAVTFNRPDVNVRFPAPPQADGQEALPL